MLADLTAAGARVLYGHELTGVYDLAGGGDRREMQRHGSKW